jgi:hypothetical protein
MSIDAYNAISFQTLDCEALRYLPFALILLLP